MNTLQELKIKGEKWRQRKKREREKEKKEKYRLKDFFLKKGISFNHTVNLIQILTQTNKIVKIWNKMFMILRSFKI